MNFTRIFSYFFTRMYPYVSRMYPYVSRMYPYVTRMLVVCYSYVSVCFVCYSYVTRMYSCGVLVMILIYHQVISSFWKWQLLYYSSASQFFTDFGAHFVETQARFQQACEPFLLTEQILKNFSHITFQP